MKKISRRVLVMLSLALVTVALSAVGALAAPKLKKVKYDGRGKVEADFYGRVQYRNLKVTVKDNKGAAYRTRITDRDNDELDFVILNYKQGRTYSFTVSGIKKRAEKKYGKVTGKVKIPAAAKKAGKVTVRDVEYDAEDRELDFEFSRKVEWKAPKITVTSGGSNYVIFIEDIDDDDLSVFVKRLTRGRTYQYKISGVRLRGTSAYTTVSGSFVA